jgi:hypothetical protein
MKPVVPGERELEEAVLALRALADVVDDPGRFAAIGCGNDDGDVREMRRNRAGDEVARPVVGGV